MKRASNEESPNVEPQMKQTPVKEEKKRRYFHVKFFERSDDSQPEDIALTLNGETLVVRRGVDTILPEAYIEIAEHATIIGRKYDPMTNTNSPRVTKRYAFSIGSEATEEEFLELKNAGTKKTKEALKRKEAEGS